MNLECEGLPIHRETPLWVRLELLLSRDQVDRGNEVSTACVSWRPQKACITHPVTRVVLTAGDRTPNAD
jgi:hypothetical protein